MVDIDKRAKDIAKAAARKVYEKRIKSLEDRIVEQERRIAYLEKIVAMMPNPSRIQAPSISTDIPKLES